MTDKIYKPVISELLDYSIWYKEESGLLVYAANKLTPDLAIATTKLFCPDFSVYEECVFLAYRFYESAYVEWKEKLDGNLEAVEQMINHVHLAQDLLIYPLEKLSYENIAYLGDTLLKTWKAALEATFPSRRFQISGEKDGDFDDFVITFWQNRTSSDLDS